MAYDPILTSFIVVGIVGGVAVVMNVSTDWGITDELARATDRWTAAMVTRRYDRDATAKRRQPREAAILQAHGYEAALVRGEGAPRGPEPVSAPGGSDLPAAPPTDETIVVTYRLT